MRTKKYSTFYVNYAESQNWWCVTNSNLICIKINQNFLYLFILFLLLWLVWKMASLTLLIYYKVPLRKRHYQIKCFNIVLMCSTNWEKNNVVLYLAFASLLFVWKWRIVLYCSLNFPSGKFVAFGNRLENRFIGIF